MQVGAAAILPVIPVAHEEAVVHARLGAGPGLFLEVALVAGGVVGPARRRRTFGIDVGRDQQRPIVDPEHASRFRGKRRHLAGCASRRVHHPHLRAAVARGDEGQTSSVGTPARARVRLRVVGDPSRSAARGRDHPDVGVARPGGGVHLRGLVRHRLSIRRDLRIRDPLQTHHLGRRERRRGRGGEQGEEQDGQIHRGTSRPIIGEAPGRA